MNSYALIDECVILSAADKEDFYCKDSKKLLNRLGIKAIITEEVADELLCGCAFRRELSDIIDRMTVLSSPENAVESYMKESERFYSDIIKRLTAKPKTRRKRISPEYMKSLSYIYPKQDARLRKKFIENPPDVKDKRLLAYALHWNNVYRGRFYLVSHDEHFVNDMVREALHFSYTLRCVTPAILLERMDNSKS